MREEKQAQVLVRALLAKKVKKCQIADYCETKWQTVHGWAEGFYNPNQQNMNKLLQLYQSKQ